MQLGGFYIWTITFQMIKASSMKLRDDEAAEEFSSKQPNKNLDATPQSQLLKGESEEQVAIVVVSVTSYQSVLKILGTQQNNFCSGSGISYH